MFLFFSDDSILYSHCVRPSLITMVNGHKQEKTDLMTLSKLRNNSNILVYIL